MKYFRKFERWGHLIHWWDLWVRTKKFHNSRWLLVVVRNKRKLTINKVGGDRKGVLVEHDMVRKVEAVGLDIEALVSILSERVAEKDTRSGFGIEFAVVIWFEPWIAKTTKCAELEIIWWAMSEGFKGSFAM